MSSVMPDGPGAQSPVLPSLPGVSGADLGCIPIGAVVGGALFAGCSLVAAFLQETWEYPLMRALNAGADHSALLDRGIHALTTRDLLQGVVFVSLLWYLWFWSTESVTRARLLAGTVAATLAGILSRLLQIVLPTHLRPLHTPGLAFVLPMGVEPDALNHFNSFPSDHGAVFFGLALVIYRIRPRLGVPAFIWAMIVDLGRVYEGYHYPSDIVGSVGLAVLVVSAFDNRWCIHLARRVLVFEQAWRPSFYLLAFLLTYQIATLFDDVREIGRGFTRVVLHHDPFASG